MATRTASIRLDREKLERLDRLAAALSRSRAWVINQSIDRYLDYEEWFFPGSAWVPNNRRL